MTIYVKTPGFNDFFRVSATIRTTCKGYEMLSIREPVPISRYQYYKQPEAVRFVLDLDTPGGIWQFANFRLFEQLHALNNN